MFVILHTNLYSLQNYIKRYTFKSMGFSALRQLIEVELDSGYANHLVQTVIPKMAGLALAIHTLITQVCFCFSIEP